MGGGYPPPQILSNKSFNNRQVQFVGSFPTPHPRSDPTSGSEDSGGFRSGAAEFGAAQVNAERGRASMRVKECEERLASRAKKRGDSR